MACGPSPADDEGTVRASFTWIGEDEGGEVAARGFARGYVAVVRADEPYVRETEIERDRELVSDGNWNQ